MTVDLTTRVGSLVLPNPIMTASGTAGHSDEFKSYLKYRELGAFVAKSVCAEPWAGNPAPRVHELRAGMINSVGLPGPGVEAWLEKDLPALLKRTDRIVASIWGFTVEAYEKAATMMAQAPPQVIAVEVNVSCPNTDNADRMFAASARATAEVIEASRGVDRPLWAKLSPAVNDIVEIADAAYGAGAEAVTLTNTVPGMLIDIEERKYMLGAGPRGGGVSGAALHPIVVRMVHDVRKSFPDKAIVAAGGVYKAEDAVEFLMAGANAVQVGTASFLDPRAANKIVQQLERWCAKHKVQRVSELVGVIHDDDHG